MTDIFINPPRAVRRVKEVERLEELEHQVDEVETALSYYQALSKNDPGDREALEELVYKGEYLKEHLLRTLFLIRKRTTRLAHGLHHREDSKPHR